MNKYVIHTNYTWFLLSPRFCSQFTALSVQNVFMTLHCIHFV